MPNGGVGSAIATGMAAEGSHVAVLDRDEEHGREVVCQVGDKGGDARFWQPFVARGFTPDSGAAWLLPRTAGMARARELLILGRELSGTEAERWGLIHRAVNGDELDREAAALVAKLASSATVAVGLTKRLLNTGVSLDLHAHLATEAFALEVSSRSRDFKEGLLAFTEKRPPEFEGR